ncbi:hypothetical protein Tco_1123918 [Tanacetum coccineum]|uniref:Uncharacterized protein n=1 Tax=Tanacetum coccineum TaxID=301880 RepID=A0ABQ5J7P8_9ASTR
MAQNLYMRLILDNRSVGTVTSLALPYLITATLALTKLIKSVFVTMDKPCVVRAGAIMSSITTQQSKLDLELVPKEQRLEIGKCNERLNPRKKQTEPTFQVVLDALALTPCYFTFLITADVPEVEIKSITDVVVDQMHQPWRNFATIINRSLSGKTTGLDKLCLSRARILWAMYYKKNLDYVELLWEDFTYQIDNRAHKKQDKIARLPKSMTSPEMWETKAYKTYLGYATGVTPPKKARKFKKPASPKLFIVPTSPEEPIRKSKRVKRPVIRFDYTL